MLVDSLSFTDDETAASVDSQAQLLLGAGPHMSRPRPRAVEPSADRRHEPLADDTEGTGR